MTRRLLNFMTLLSLLLGGCQRRVEYPIGPKDRLRQFHAGRLDLRQGTPTVTDVQLVMGRPDYRNATGTFIAYYWETIDTVEPAPPVTDADDFDSLRDYTRHVLALHFGDRGDLVRHRHLRLSGSSDLARWLDRLARRWKVAPPVPAGGLTIGPSRDPEWQEGWPPLGQQQERTVVD